MLQTYTCQRRGHLKVPQQMLFFIWLIYIILGEGKVVFGPEDIPPHVFKFKFRSKYAISKILRLSFLAL